MNTATQELLKIDARKNLARRYAAQFVYELRDFISPHSLSEARYSLERFFYKEEVEITTAQSRRLTCL